jgi:peroxiredoxin
MPATITVLSDAVHEVPGQVGGTGATLAAGSLTDATGWTLQPEGLCRGEVCVPVHDRAALVIDRPDPQVDLTVLATLVDQPIVVDADHAIVALGPPSTDRHGLRTGDVAPAFALPGIDRGTVTLDESQGKKRLLLTWSSWCGCRHELPAWQQHYEELRDHNFEIIAVAIDDNTAVAKPFVDEAGAEYPCAIDPDHHLVESYGIVNVPSAVWIDEAGRVVRTPDIAYGDRMWIDFHGVAPEPHLDALRAWVTEDRLPEGADARDARRPPTENEVRAQLHYRIAVHLHRAGAQEPAEQHFATAAALAPFDWTIRRGSMPLRGSDPFGPEFMAFWDEWEAAGKPLYD